MVWAARKSLVLPEMGKRAGAGGRRRIRNSAYNLARPGLAAACGNLNWGEPRQAASVGDVESLICFFPF